MTLLSRSTLSVPATAAVLALASLVGCVSQPPAPAPVEAPPPAAAPAPAAAPVAAPPTAAAPAPVSELAELESVLTRVAGDSGVNISRTPSGALLIRATGDTAFGTASAVPSARFNAFLQQLANGLGTHTHLSAKVTGHTDSVGNAALNDRLSTNRANATINRLIALGVASARLVGEGRGQREPIAGNDTAEGRAANRRVEILVIELPN
jgi:outer membrane protein OmpA-like peptidoglycan-associated protein